MQQLQCWTDNGATTRAIADRSLSVAKHPEGTTLEQCIWPGGCIGHAWLNKVMHMTSAHRTIRYSGDKIGLTRLSVNGDVRYRDSRRDNPVSVRYQGVIACQQHGPTLYTWKTSAYATDVFCMAYRRNLFPWMILVTRVILLLRNWPYTNITMIICRLSMHLSYEMAV